MIKSPARLRQELDDLRRAFLAQLPVRVQAIEITLGEALGAEEVDRSRVDELFHLAHRLCGSAGIYGCPKVHIAAGAVERAAEALRDPGAKVAPGRLAELRQLVEALQWAARDAAAEAAQPD